MWRRSLKKYSVFELLKIADFLFDIGHGTRKKTLSGGSAQAKVEEAWVLPIVNMLNLNQYHIRKCS